MIKVFSNIKNELGEGALWHPIRQTLLWLDINNKTLFEKHINSSAKAYDECWDLPEIGSALAISKNGNNLIYIITDKSFASFDLGNGLFKVELALGLQENMRANDGGVSPDGTFWFGTMEKKPSGTNGSIYSINSSGLIKEQFSGIGIPNTMTWSNDGNKLFLSDSWQQTMYSFDVINGNLIRSSQTEVLNLRSTQATPDGGATDINGNIWNAHWDGFKIVCLSPNGQILQEFAVPIPKPTCCCFGGANNSSLFITSAREGMNEQELDQYPLSGAVFMLNIQTLGSVIPSFLMDK
jgi:sugar lactone lactonase YvrE